MVNFRNLLFIGFYLSCFKVSNWINICVNGVYLSGFCHQRVIIQKFRSFHHVVQVGWPRKGALREWDFICVSEFIDVVTQKWWILLCSLRRTRILMQPELCLKLICLSTRQRIPDQTSISELLTSLIYHSIKRGEITFS